MTRTVPTHWTEASGPNVGALDFRDRPACPPDVFSRRVLDLARTKFPLLDCQPAPDFQIKLGESKVNLFNFYRSYMHAPEEFESIVLPALATVVQVQEWGSDQTEPSLEVVCRRVMPMLYPEEVWRERFPNFIGVPWVGGLVVPAAGDPRWRDRIRALEVRRGHRPVTRGVAGRSRPRSRAVANE